MSTMPAVMKDTGRTKEHAGRLYRCQKCGVGRWTCFGIAKNHYPDHCPEADEESSTEVKRTEWSEGVFIEVWDGDEQLAAIPEREAEKIAEAVGYVPKEPDDE